MSMKVYALKAMRPEMKGIIRDLRVLFVLEELGLPYERIALDPSKGENKSEAYLKISPTGKVPAFVDGDFVLFESAAINDYLSEKHGRFIPERGSQKYFLHKQWLYFILTNLDPQAARLYGADFFMEKNETTSAIRALALEQVVRFLKTLDDHFAENTYFVGNDVTIADFTLAASLTAIRHANLLPDYPNLNKHFALMTARPSFQKAFALNGT